jgi:hypothetical protein
VSIQVGRITRRIVREMGPLAGSLLAGCGSFGRGDAGWSSPVARQAHNLKVVGSNPTPATTFTDVERIRNASPGKGEKLDDISSQFDDVAVAIVAHCDALDEPP